MSSSNDIEITRAWMYNKWDPVKKANTKEFNEGLKGFISYARNLPIALQSGKISCPCLKCGNSTFIAVDTVANHLFSVGFTPCYYYWLSHGEYTRNLGGDSSSGTVELVGRRRCKRRVAECLAQTTESLGLTTESLGQTTESLAQTTETQGTVGMVNEVFREAGIDPTDTDRSEEPNAEARRFFEMLDAASNPIYEGCKVGHSALSAASRMMAIKTDNNLSEYCVDQILEFLKDYLPEDNFAPGTYDEAERLVSGMGLPYQVIDVCVDNCMIYWGDEDKDRKTCKVCDKERYQVTKGRTKVPHKRMWYLPMADRLKRLYQSQVTASAMRWHAEHDPQGEISHPSDAKAWQHFHTVYPSFARESRNVYLGLCTDGFNPFGKTGRKYSLWPVIVTPYNLPPTLCMKREYLYLTVIVPGPDHPKRALDIFLQPLVRELEVLWYEGVEAFDVSRSQNFRMRAVLMWTISDFPAYAMLSGWTTHGKLACPYCGENTDSFQLQHGRKTSWFDCHRRFLDGRHPYRKNKRLFRKRIARLDAPPPELSGQELLDQINQYRVLRTPDCKGALHKKTTGYGEKHHWHKKSIFWDLPYWKDHLLRHNLDVMHIEKNFFDNIINTVLNVQGKTKDNLKSRLDLPELCCRESLHVQDGVGPIPSFRLEDGKSEFFEWLRNSVKYPDGYAANLANCVDDNKSRLAGMKSHDCHVFMQRLLPMAFTHLLQKDVHEAIAGVGAFFRDLCSRTHTEAGVETLKERIPIILCNMEKLFPPSFFDVMEHLPIHLPRELELGGPVQYRWMYPFERYMFHLKKKVKNPSRVEGSIVAQQIREETSAFSSHYFPSTIKTKATKPGRYDDGGEKPVYPTVVPDMFAQIGRLSGKRTNGVLNEMDHLHIHKYILANCDELDPYVSTFCGRAKHINPRMTDAEMDILKQDKFHEWLAKHISKRMEHGERFPTWLVELSKGPTKKISLYPQYCTRGYVFQVNGRGRTRTTVNNGVLVRSGPTEYYGVLEEILVVEYPGYVNLQCVMFRCKWYNPIEELGLKRTKFGVTEVNTSKKLPQYDPFCTASQADQVCYVRYPRSTNKKDPWVTVHPINPRGRVAGLTEQDPLQQLALTGDLSLIDQSLQEPVLAEAGNDDVLEDWNSEEEELSDIESDGDSELSSDNNSSSE